ncbi:MAG: right-handed parallel beta-helix repeat-containing protein, partial [Candidatus Micrarchaeota archaeon]
MQETDSRRVVSISAISTRLLLLLLLSIGFAFSAIYLPTAVADTSAGGSISVAAVNASDDIKSEYHFSTYNESSYEQFNFTKNYPSNMTFGNISIFLESLEDASTLAAKIEVWTNSTQTWNNLSFTTASTDHNTTWWNITLYVNTSQDVNALAVRYLAWKTGGSVKFAYVDYVHLNITNVTDPTAPNVTLNSPSDGYTNTTSSGINVTFNCSAADNYQLANISLFITDSANSSFSLNQTASVSGIGNSSQWVLNLSAGAYTWNCRAEDNSSNTAWGTANRSIIISPSANVTLNSPAQNLTANSSTINFNFTVTGASPPFNCSLYLDSVLNRTNSSVQNNTPTNFSVSGIADGNHSWYVQCTDTSSGSASSETRNFTVDTASPLWSDPQVNTTPVYWNQTVAFNTSWTDAGGLSGYIFSTNQSGAWANSSLALFSGAANTSYNVSAITAAPGTSVGWYFWANDTAGNYNQTTIQNFTVMARPTTLAFSVNQSVYPQGRSPGSGYDIYIPFQARYLDSLTGQPVSGAVCYVANDETSDNVTLTYNSSTGNYTGNVTDYLMYYNVTFNASCSAVNYTDSVNSTSASVWLFLYLWEWENRTFYSGNDSTTHWLRKELPNGTPYSMTNEVDLSSGSTLMWDYPMYGSGLNGTFLKDYLMDDLVILRANLSATPDISASCSPYLCHAVKDSGMNVLEEGCDAEQGIPAITPTLIESNSSRNFSISQGNYLYLRIYLNCTSPASGNLTIYYNYTNQPANVEIRSPHPYSISSYLGPALQVDAGYNVGPNQYLNATRNATIYFNNTGTVPRYVRYLFYPRIQIQFPDSLIPDTIYVYNSSGQLWASDNASAGAPQNATTYSSNTVECFTEIFPNSTLSNETFRASVHDAIRDNESLVLNDTLQKAWNISVQTVFLPIVTTYNATVWTDYSAYGVPDGWSFNVTMTNASGTYDITAQTLINASADTLTFPATDIVSDILSFSVIATIASPPNLIFADPTPGNATAWARNWAFINITSDRTLHAALLEWNGTNESMGNSSATNWFKNKTGIVDGVYTYKVYGNNSVGNWGISETRTITIDTTPPNITFVDPTLGNGSARDLDWAYINITSDETLNASILEWNGTNESMSGSGTNWYTNKTGLSLGVYTYRVFGNDSAGNWGVSETRTYIYDSPPSVIVIEPLGGSYPDNRPVPIAINATDSDGISAAIATIHHPITNTTENITLYPQPTGDDFSSDTIGTDWFVENTSIGPSQTCVADINGTIAGKAFTSLSGDGSPETDTLCSIVSNRTVYGDFDANISFEILSSEGVDNAINFQVMEVNTSADTSTLAFITLSNWTGLGRNYEVFVDDGIVSEYIATRPTNDTSGRFRITRAGSNFSFYTWNSTGSSWIFENSSTLNLSNALFFAFESESAYPGWGAMNASWDNLSISSTPDLHNIFYDPGHYAVLHNVTFSVNDTLGVENSTERTNFTIVDANNRPSKPFILAPAVGDIISGTYDTVWSAVTDIDNDTLRFNITLLNTDGSDNATIISDYGNISSNNYLWDTTAYQDGLYSLRVTVYENATSEGLSNSYTLPGSFRIRNQVPSVVILSPLGESHYKGAEVSLSVNATDSVGIDSAIAIVSRPNGSVVNVTLYSGQHSDSFSNNTVGTDWHVEDWLEGPSQTCVADINATFPGKAFTSLSGNGAPQTDTLCSLIADKPLDGDFDASISFNLTSGLGADGALNFQLLEGNSSADARELVFIALSNWTGLGVNYEVFVSGEDLSDYILRRPTNDTYGRFRITRVGDNFTFYTWNDTGSSWSYENSTLLDICRPLYLSFESESAVPGWGTANATWDDLVVVDNNATFAAFSDTLAIGTYNVTFYVNNTLGGLNDSEKTNFTILDENQPPSKPFILLPSIGSVLYGTRNITWSGVTDLEDDALRFNITLLNQDGSDNDTIVSGYGNNSSVNYEWDTSVWPDGEYSLRVTVYENETPEGLSNSYTLPGTFFIDNLPPSVIILAPLGENYSQSRPVSLSINATDAEGVFVAIAQVSLPNGSVQNFTLDKGLQSDLFEADTVGTAWTVENVSIGPSQTCTADINTTIPGKAYTSLSGDGTPKTDTLCTLISGKAVDGDFDIQIDFNIEEETGTDHALNFQVTAIPTSAGASRMIFIALSNWTGLGRNYEIFADDGNFSDYILTRPTEDTSGKMRIKRVGDNFTFFTWNNTANDWTEESVSQNEFDFARAVYVSFESETAFPDWGNMSVGWDNFTVSDDNNTFHMFNETSALGLYNVTFFANDTLGRMNDSEKTNFTIVYFNSPPSTPYLLIPYPDQLINGTINITWSGVSDFEGDPLRFNITLLNPDNSFNSTIVSDYGDANSTSFSWNTVAYPDGNYSMEIVVYENETPEGFSNSYTLPGNLTLANAAPAIQFVPPTEDPGSYLNRDFIQANVTALGGNLVNVTIYLYNSTGALVNSSSSASSPLFANFTGLPDGLYQLNATAINIAGNRNSTGTRNVTVQRNCPVIMTSGSYILTQDSAGAPNDASPLSGSACVKINASDVVFDCDGYNITNNGTAGTTYGILLFGPLTNVTVRDCQNVSGYAYGIFAYRSNLSILTNITTANNSEAGFYLDLGYDNNLTNDISQDNAKHGFYLNGSANNTLADNLASSNSLAGYYLMSSDNNSFQNDTSAFDLDGIDVDASSSNNFSALNLTNELTSFVIYPGSNNNTVSGSVMTGGIDADDIIDVGTSSGNLFEDIAIRSLNDTGNDGLVRIYGNPALVTFDNVSIDSDAAYAGFILDACRNATIRNSIVNGTAYSIRFTSGANDNAIQNNRFENASIGGISATSTYGNIFANNTIAGNARFGADIRNSNVSFSNDRFYGNGLDLNLTENIGSTMAFNATNITFDNPSGGFQNHTSLYINDSLSSESYSINWTTNSSALPAGRTSFAGKYVDITRLAGSVSISSILWHWEDAESAGYDESSFQLWKYNASGWAFQNGTPDTASNALSLSDMDPASIYGILLQNDTTAPSINLTFPTPGFITNVSTLNFNFTAIDDTSSVMNCSLFLDGAINKTNSTTQNNTATNFSVPGIVNGLHYWNVTCTDEANNTAISETRNFTVDLVYPGISILLPTNSTYSSGSVPLNFTATDNFGISACWYFVDGAGPTYNCSNTTM